MYYNLSRYIKKMYSIPKIDKLIRKSIQHQIIIKKDKVSSIITIVDKTACPR